MKNIFLHTFTIVILTLSSGIFAQNLRNVKVGIVYSEKTKQLIYPHNKDFYPIQDWELFFLNRKISYSVINDEQLDDNDFDFLDVLILPSVEVLSQNAKDNLREFLSDGKGLLIFGKIGTSDAEGRETFSNYLTELSNLSIRDLNTAGKTAEHHTIKKSSLLGRNITGDYDLLILNKFQPLAASVNGENVIQTGKYVLDSKNKNRTESTGIILSEQKSGRIAWFGFQFSQIIGNETQENTVEKAYFQLNRMAFTQSISIAQTLPG